MPYFYKEEGSQTSPLLHHSLWFCCQGLDVRSQILSRIYQKTPTLLMEKHWFSPKFSKEFKSKQDDLSWKSIVSDNAKHCFGQRKALLRTPQSIAIDTEKTLLFACQPRVSLCHPLTRRKSFVAGRCVSLTT